MTDMTERLELRMQAWHEHANARVLKKHCLSDLDSSTTLVPSWYHWRHLKISAGPGQRIPMEIPGYGGSLFQSTSGVKI